MVELRFRSDEDKLVSTNGVTDTAVTETQILTALDAELERLLTRELVQHHLVELLQLQIKGP